jgi:PEP-CTERM motif-containing protein
MLRTRLALAAAVASAVSASALADSFTPLTMPTLNTNMRTFTDGSVYDNLWPTSGSPNPNVLMTAGGIPFAFAQDPSGNTAFIGTFGTTSTLTMTVDKTGITDVYTLINAAYSQTTSGNTIGSVVLNFAGGVSVTENLVSGNNVRDHFFGSFVNTTTAPNVTQAAFETNAPGTAHLDMQTWSVPAADAGRELLNVEFIDMPNAGVDPVLAAATVGTVTSTSVPEPASSVLLLGGLAALAARFRRRQLTA